MRHFYFRLIIGLVFAGCAVYSLVTANTLFALMYMVLGSAFLYSACTIRKKGFESKRKNYSDKSDWRQRNGGL